MRWVISVFVGAVVGMVAALVVLAVASWVEALRSEHVWLIIITGLVAGAGGACAQALRARESVLEQLAKRLPHEFVFPTVMALVGLSTLVIVSKSEGTCEEKRIYTDAVVMIVGICVVSSILFSLGKRMIANQNKALELAVFKAATHAIKDNPQFKKSVQNMCFDVVDSLLVERKPRRRSLRPPAPGESD